ncbi:MAG: hypothetical protein U9N56_03570 [Actinomycetota bacterium]|nr:hypothetical protein [Actinomycetota bacterium]
MSDASRKSIGGSSLLFGLLGLVLGVIWIHWSSLSQTEVVDGVEVDVVVDFLNWWPRGIIWKGLGYLIVLGSTTLVLAGASFLWVLNQRMTWTRAAVAAMIAWLALVFFFGMVPSEWLNFAQTDLEWSSQNIAFTVPPILVLGNEVDISFAVIKDAISGGYIVAMLGVAGVFTLQLQKIKDGRPASAAPVEPKSPYGRPLVKGGD